MRRILAASKDPKKLSLGIIPMMFISFELTISLVVGYLAARFIAGAETNTRGRFPNLVFGAKGYTIHLHHWLVAFAILFLALLFNFFVLAEDVFYGFLGGMMVQGVVQYSDWQNIIIKH